MTNQDESLLPQEHRQMVAAILRLPDRVFKGERNRYQQAYLEDRKRWWGWVGCRIDYLQRRQLGFLPEDPLFSNLLHPQQREFLDLYTRLLFETLQLAIEGFILIKETALKHNKKFPFSNPRELFTQICRDCANDLDFIFSDDLNQGSTLEEVRKSLIISGKFFRGSLNNPKTESEILAKLKNGDWSDFWVVGLLEHRFKPQFLDYWKRFLKAHKKLTAFFNQSQPQGDAILGGIKWDAGYPSCPKSKIPILYGESS